MKLKNLRNWLPRPETDPSATAGAADPAAAAAAAVVDPAAAVPDPAAAAVVDPAAVVEPAVETPAGAPETYADFTLPEGVELAPALLDGLRERAKELNLDQASAQKLVDFAAAQRATFMDNLVEAQTQAVASWKEQTQNDKEIGGAHFDRSVAAAADVVKQFGSPELNAFLEASGLGFHPEMVRMMAKVRAVISDDRFVPGGVANQQGPKSLYSASQMNP